MKVILEGVQMGEAKSSWRNAGAHACALMPRVSHAARLPKQIGVVGTLIFGEKNLQI